MWPVDHALHDWFEALDTKRNSSNDRSGDTTVPLMDNEFSRR